MARKKRRKPAYPVGHPIDVIDEGWLQGEHWITIEDMGDNPENLLYGKRTYMFAGASQGEASYRTGWETAHLTG